MKLLFEEAIVWFGDGSDQVGQVFSVEDSDENSLNVGRNDILAVIDADRITYFTFDNAVIEVKK